MAKDEWTASSAGSAPYRIDRRVAGDHDIRLDGITDLIVRARGASVMDIGCNRGMVGYELAKNGARLVHGCDIYEPGILTAREVFADLRSVESQFEVVDLRGGAQALEPFGDRNYDIVVMLATYHKLKRVMPQGDLSDLIKHLGKRTNRYFGWRGTGTDIASNKDEMKRLDADLGSVGLIRIHTSHISETLGVAAIWKK